MFGSCTVNPMVSKYYFVVLIYITGNLLISRPVLNLRGKLNKTFNIPFGIGKNNDN